MSPKIEYERAESPTSDEAEGMDRLHWERLNLEERIHVKEKLRLFQITTALLALALLAVFTFIVAEHIRPHPHQALLGADQSNFVPEDVGYPLRWTVFDHEDPFYVEEDTFDSIEKTREVTKRLKAVHNSSNVLVNGKHASYRDNDGNTHQLPTYVTSTGHEVYILRAFHQIHCIIVITEEYGFRVNNHTSQWAPGHIAHCINTLREAVTCLADATPLSFLEGVGVGHVTDGKQGLCRNYAALRSWANDPVRITRTKNVAPEGSDKDILVEVFG